MFLLKIGFAVILFSVLIVGVYLVLHAESKKGNAFKDNACVFVWGDSQTVLGLDVKLLGEKLSRTIQTSARVGSGVYDFLVSEKNTLDHAMCIVAFPECALLRNPLSDNNRTGFELSCLQTLYFIGCPLDECLRIANLNSSNVYYKTFGAIHDLLPYSDKIICPEPLAGFCGMFTEVKDYFFWKANAYTTGIQRLFDKQSQIVLIQFPFEQQVENCARNSINRHLTDSLKFELIEKYTMKYDTIVLHSDSLLMHDLSHLNEVGARMLTCRIADSLRKDTINNRFFTMVIE